MKKVFIKQNKKLRKLKIWNYFFLLKVKFGKLRQKKCPSVYSLFSSPLRNVNSTPEPGVTGTEMIIILFKKKKYVFKNLELKEKNDDWLQKRLGLT